MTPPKLDELVRKLRRLGVELPPGPLRAGEFGDSPALSEELIALIRIGRKRATAGLVWGYEADEEALPRAGDIEIVADHAGEPALVLRYLAVEVLPFEAVGAEFAAREGEGDGSLAYWREAHRAFFARECRRIGREPDEAMPVVCADFEIAAAVPYDPNGEALDRARLRSQSACQEFNALSPGDRAGRARLLSEILGKPAAAIVRSPFFCDYGYNLDIGEAVFINVNCVVLDTFRVTIGARTLLGPGVQIYAASHPLDVDERNTGIENGGPVTIGEDVWLAGGVIVCPGVTIGAGTVVGAGSVVTRSLPPLVFAAGNPCRVIRGLGKGEARRRLP